MIKITTEEGLTIEASSAVEAMEMLLQLNGKKSNKENTFELIGAQYEKTEVRVNRKMCERLYEELNYIPTMRQFSQLIVNKWDVSFSAAKAHASRMKENGYAFKQVRFVKSK